MDKKLISSILVVALLNLFGCYSVDYLTVPQYEQVERKDGKPEKIKVTTKDYEEYQFSNSNFYIQNDTLYGKGKLLIAVEQEPIERKIALSDIVTIEVESFDLGDTCLLGGGIYLGIGLLVFIVWLAAGAPMIEK